MKTRKFLFIINSLFLLFSLTLMSCTEDTSVTSDCPEWYQIKSRNVGNEQCVRGIVKRTWYEPEQDFTYIFFSGDVNEFFLGFDGDVIDSAIVGDCYTATGWLEETEYGTPYIIPDSFTRCRAEQQVVPTESSITALPVPAANFDLSKCMNWEEIDLSYVGQEVCIQGTAWTTNFEDDEYGGFFYIEFGGRMEDVYIAVDGANLEGIEGHCVVGRGILEKEEGYDIPYLWIYPEELYHCDP